MTSLQDRLRQLPAVDALLQREIVQAWMTLYGRRAVVDTLRATIDTTRQRILADDRATPDTSHILAQSRATLERRFLPTLRPVINATGIVIHTNLGRALLSQAAQDAIQAVARHYNNLEFNLETGKRGSRYVHAEESLKELTGAEAALVVNNNAAALVLVLSALAQGHSGILSRGQLVEIGGGFRIPDIMRQSGARLIEVGTTNRTRIDDYTANIAEDSAMFLRIHASNFRQLGFVQSPSLAEMAQAAHDHDLLLVDDLGSGTLLNTDDYGLLHEPTIHESVAADADVILFSGDKLLGGPQAGIIIGKAPLIQSLKRHPLARAMRVDKLCYAALSATLDHYRRDEATTHIPVWRMIATRTDELQARALRWRNQIGGQVIGGESAIGGGSLPGTSLPTALLAYDPPSAERFAARLRSAEMPVIVRIADDRVLLDPRTVLPEQDDKLLATVQSVINEDTTIIHASKTDR